MEDLGLQDQIELAVAVVLELLSNWLCHFSRMLAPFLDRTIKPEDIKGAKTNPRIAKNQ